MVTFTKSQAETDKQKEIIFHCLTRQIVVSDYDIPFHDFMHVMHLAALCVVIFIFVHLLLAEELLNVITFIVIIKKYLPLGDNDLCQRNILEPFL